MDLTSIVGIVFTTCLAYFIYCSFTSTSKITGDKTTRRRSLSRIGRAALVSEIETNLSIATTVMMLDGPIKTSDLIEHLQHSFADQMFIRFRSVVENDDFVEVEGAFDPSPNISTIELSPGQTPFDFAASITNTHLNPSLPLWECCIIENYQGKAFCIWRAHHCIGDGMSLVAAFMQMSDEGHELQKTIRQLMKSSVSKPPSPRPRCSFSPLNHLTQLGLSILTLGKAVWIVIRKLTLLAIRPEPSTIFKNKGGQRKQLRYIDNLKVEDVKAIGRAYGATLNDIMLGVVAGAMRRVLEADENAHSNSIMSKDLCLRCAIPVDMRSSKAMITTTSNQFSSLMIDLPVGEVDVHERLRKLVCSTKEAKQSLEKMFVYLCGHVIGTLPEFLVKPIVKLTTSRVSIAITNVRGPPVILTLCGRKCISFTGFVCPPPTVNLGVTIFSMGDALGVTLLSDVKILPNPDLFMDSIEAELEEFKKAIKTKTK